MESRIGILRLSKTIYPTKLQSIKKPQVKNLLSILPFFWRPQKNQKAKGRCKNLNACGFAPGRARLNSLRSNTASLLLPSRSPQPNFYNAAAIRNTRKYGEQLCKLRPPTAKHRSAGFPTCISGKQRSLGEQASLPAGINA